VIVFDEEAINELSDVVRNEYEELCCDHEVHVERQGSQYADLSPTQKLKFLDKLEESKNVGMCLSIGSSSWVS